MTLQRSLPGTLLLLIVDIFSATITSCQKVATPAGACGQFPVQNLCLPRNQLPKYTDSSFVFYYQPQYPRDCKEVRDQCSWKNVSGGYTIKPDGYMQDFDVYCDHTFAYGDWTVILRRFDGSVTFERDWNSYKKGFGFLGSEFWIGNEKLSLLTNQAVYELYIDMTLSNGSSVYFNYKSFRISDEYSQYSLVSVRNSSSNASCVISTCPQGMSHEGFSCQRLCSDSMEMNNDCGDDCLGTCRPNGCFVNETNSFISEAENYTTSGCFSICTCIDNQLLCVNHTCGPNAVCDEQNDVSECKCLKGYVADGDTCTPVLPTDCLDVYNNGQTEDGLYTIKSTTWNGSAFQAYCNMTDQGGWTVFQRRMDGSVNFHLDWEDYKHGFGSSKDEHWLGNDKIFSITNQRNYQLRIDLVSHDGSPYFAKFQFFRINDEVRNYRLTVESYIEGNAGDSLTSYHNNQDFTTRDRDNDDESSRHFAEVAVNGAWWWGPIDYYIIHCELNSLYGDDYSICWHTLPGYNCNIKYTEMKVRPV